MKKLAKNLLISKDILSDKEMDKIVGGAQEKIKTRIVRTSGIRCHNTKSRRGCINR